MIGKQKQGIVVKGSRRRRVLRSLINVLVLVVIFVLGVGVGGGQIKTNFRKHFSAEDKSLPAHLDYSSVDRVYQSLRDNYDGKLTAEQLTDGLKHGLATSTKDPYTVYFTAKEAKDFTDQLNNSFSGIGAQLGQDAEGNLEVIAPIDDLPAAKAGIKAKDIIADINGVSTSGISVDDAVGKIRGPKDTKVTLKIVRNKKEVLDITVVRDSIVLPSVKSKILDGNIGYLQISTFANDTSELSQKAAQSFKDAKVKAVILDLRNDPGGLLDAAVNVSSLWLSAGQNILQEKRGTEVVQSYSALGGDILHGIPTVILVNDGSASASEITAGALHDNKAAYIIGTKSYGKGVVQQLICVTGSRDLKGNCPADTLKVTIASWYRPDGENINHKGISPDKVVKISDADAKDGTDTQLKAAQDYLNK